jgi:hypothetical protein
MHDRDLTGRATKADESKLEPKAQRFAETNLSFSGVDAHGRFRLVSGGGTSIIGKIRRGVSTAKM